MRAKTLYFSSKPFVICYNCLIYIQYFWRVFLNYSYKTIIIIKCFNLKGGVILIGGQSGNKILDAIYELKSIAGTWKEIVPKLKIPRRNFASWIIPSDFFYDCSTGLWYFLLPVLKYKFWNYKNVNTFSQ